MNYGTVLKLDIERFAADARSGNELLAKARAGRVGPQAIAVYLGSLLHLVRQTPPCLADAEARARELGRGDLAAYLGRKRLEELGHELWAEHDLQVLQSRYGIGNAGCARSMEEMVAYVRELARRAPLRYVGYALFAEYLTVLLGPEWVTTLERRCAIPASAVSIVVRHAELDREHAASSFVELDELLQNASELAELRQTLGGVMELFSRFTREISAIAA